MAVVLSVLPAAPATAGPLDKGEPAAQPQVYPGAVQLNASVTAAPLDEGRAALQRKDYPEALRIFRSLAEQGVAAGEYNLGVMYFNGYGVPQDYAETVKWYRKSAEQGYAHAQFFLGHMYKDGKGVPRDYVQAYKWLSLSAAQAGAAANAGARDKLAAEMTPEQIAEGEKLAREWKPAGGGR